MSKPEITIRCFCGFVASGVDWPSDVGDAHEHAASTGHVLDVHGIPRADRHDHEPVVMPPEFEQTPEMRRAAKQGLPDL